MAPRTNQRRKKLIERRLQLRLGFSILLAAASCLLFQALLLGHELRGVADSLPKDQELIRRSVPGVLLWSSMIATLLLVPVSMGIGVQWMFKVVGPLYRFRVYLGQVLAGEMKGPCQIRRTDELHHMCERISLLTAPIRGQEAIVPESIGQPGSEEKWLRVRSSLVFVSVATAAVLVQLLVSTNTLMGLSTEFGSSGQAFETRIPELTWNAFWKSLVLLVPLTLALGTLAIHGVIRQLSLLRTTLDRAIRGEATLPLVLRATDELSDLFALVREADAAASRARRSAGDARTGAQAAPLRAA